MEKQDPKKTVQLTKLYFLKIPLEGIQLTPEILAASSSKTTEESRSPEPIISNLESQENATNETDRAKMDHICRLWIDPNAERRRSLSSNKRKIKRQNRYETLYDKVENEAKFYHREQNHYFEMSTPLLSAFCKILKPQLPNSNYNNKDNCEQDNLNLQSQESFETTECSGSEKNLSCFTNFCGIFFPLCLTSETFGKFNFETFSKPSLLHQGSLFICAVIIGLLILGQTNCYLVFGRVLVWIFDVIGIYDVVHWFWVGLKKITQKD